MKLDDIKRLTVAVSCGDTALENAEIRSAYAGDLMSDVLARVWEQELLITGLSNPQAVHTAQIMEIGAILFVGGKTPDLTTVVLAAKYNIAALTTSKSMFEVCALLYQNGIRA